MWIDLDLLYFIRGTSYQYFCCFILTEFSEFSETFRKNSTAHSQCPDQGYTINDKARIYREMTTPPG